MDIVTRTRIVKIGNSQGIRIPKIIIDQLKLGEEVELAVQEGKLVIRPLRENRAGWEEQFKLMAEQGDDHLFDEAEMFSE